MFRARDIAKETRVLVEVAAGPLIEITFRGKHRDGCGNELIAYVSRGVDDLRTAGVVMNFVNARYLDDAAEGLEYLKKELERREM